ncbi:L-aspartate oxidase [Sporosarcina limicola]|uniref:L-aspartate oxidase n=1 Tax=Sporosarcina limicola TaxID=34101 RepID=A0A927MFA4_9BACL|nr:L-aspartate oxidase [Sporosarcina limicola]
MKAYNCIIVGSGIAAMQLATHLNSMFNVLIITKSTKQSTNSYRAQGGIAASVGKGDSASFHYEDTILAGCGFQNNKEVHELVENGPELIVELKKRGLHFDEDENGQLALGMEGAHGRKRIVHCGGDATGKHIMEHLFSTLRLGIYMLENRFVYELIMHPITGKCMGVKVKDEYGNNETYFANTIILAVGGIGGLFSFTSNDPSITGDGIALAYRAGAEIIDMEFIQFHPTLLYINGKTAGLVSEAVRGEGARLVDKFGTLLMEGKHPLGDLAPRHIVAKEIFERRATGKDVYLDISMIASFEEKFPTITALCQANNISIKEGKIPVAPGCHFLMGGIVVDQVGKTSIDGLYAIGETASTGVHGANRLASNSLLEGLHYGKKLANHLNGQRIGECEQPVLEEPFNFPIVKSRSLPEKETLRQKMMAYAGIIRTRSELEHLEIWLNDYDYGDFVDLPLDNWCIEDIQRLFMLETAKLITTAALLREESRGAHNRADFPNEDMRWGQLHIVQSKKELGMRETIDEHHQIEIHA